LEKDIKKRAAWIFKVLKKTYPDARIELVHKTPLELLVATILSAQCTDKRVNLVTRDLFRKYRDPDDYLNTPLKTFESDIRSTGFFKNKARSIQGACRAILEEYGGRVPETMDELVRLPGVGRKTANVILGNAYHKNEGIVVDTHVIRLSGLLGLTREKNAEKIERDLMKLFPRREWTLLSHLLIRHGRVCCIARRPGCNNCSLKSQCPYAVKMKRKQ
jgi:endonuclease-3